MRVRNGYKGSGRYHRPCSSARGESDSHVHRTRSSSVSPSSSKKERLSASAPVTPCTGSSSEAKISTLLDSMLNLCGATSAAEAVRDAICDSDRKSKTRKKGGGRTGTGTGTPSTSTSTSHDSADSYMARLEPHLTSPTVTTKKLEEFPKSSTAEKAPKTPYKHKKIRSRSTSKKLSRRKSRRSASANQKDSYLEGTSSLQMDDHPAIQELHSLAVENHCALMQNYRYRIQQLSFLESRVIDPYYQVILGY
jgi:hypothetical protein